MSGSHFARLESFEGLSGCCPSLKGCSGDNAEWGGQCRTFASTSVAGRFWVKISTIV